VPSAQNISLATLISQSTVSACEWTEVRKIGDDDVQVPGRLEEVAMAGGGAGLPLRQGVYEGTAIDSRYKVQRWLWGDDEVEVCFS